MNFFAKFFSKSNPAAAVPAKEVLQLPCEADLWCRKRIAISTMLDPGLYDLYKTNDDRIDEDWIIQSNPPCAFKVEFKEGCDALLDLLQEDPGLHATKGWLNFSPPAPASAGVKSQLKHQAPKNWSMLQLGLDPRREAYLAKMEIVVRTAERELKKIP